MFTRTTSDDNSDTGGIFDDLFGDSNNSSSWREYADEGLDCGIDPDD